MEYNEGESHAQSINAFYAPIEPMAGSNTGFMTKHFIRRAVFSDGTAEYRIPAEPGCYEQVRLRLRVARGNASAAVAVVGTVRLTMHMAESDGMFDYYETIYTTSVNNVRYYFLIWCGDRFYFYNNVGVTEEHDETYDFAIMPGFKTPDWAKGAVMYQIFTDRFCNGDNTNTTKDNEYFYIGGYSREVLDWNKIPDTNGVREFYGGDLGGVLKKLDYLQYLGIEVIYFNPLFVSPSNHKYDIQDYDHIDPHFTVIVNDHGDVLENGDMDNSHADRYITRVTDLENLEASNKFFADFVQECHKRGIKVILDGVFNHCGSFNKWLDRQHIYDGAEGFESGAYESENSPYHSFFKFNGGTWPNNPNYDGWWGHDTLPKLNYEGSPELVDYILDIARKWVSPPYCCDGWRLDVAADLGHSEEFNHKFWKMFRKAVKEANPEAIIIAENYENSAKWLQGGEWDTIMNYEAFMEPVTWFLTGLEKHSDSYREDMLHNQDAFFGAMLYHMTRMNTQSLYTAMNQLSNHDHSRFMTRTNRKVGRLATNGAEEASRDIRPWCMREAIIIQMTWPGAPCVYYGDEAGVCGWTDPDNRRTYPWGNEDKSLLYFYKQMIGLHRAYDALKTGSVKFLASDRGVIAFGRFNREERMVTVVNNDDIAHNIDIPVWEIGVPDDEPMIRLVETYDSGYNFYAEAYHTERGVIAMHLEPHSAMILKNLPRYLR